MTQPKASAGKRGARKKAPAPEADAPPREPLPADAQAKHLAPGTTAADGAKGAPGAAAFEGQYRVEIPAAGFEGPLDLLLHLIQQHELDILDIPIRFITEKFLQYLAVMRSLTIDVASEYLVMAATLAHIKSKMLLPTVPTDQEDGLPGEEEEDPRAELVRRLLEYQKYKAAAAELADRSTLGKDVFGRGSSEPVPEGPAPFAELGVFSLLDAFEKILKRTNVKIDHEVIFDRISITDRMLQLHEKLEVRKAARFEDLLIEPGRTITRFDVVITFLAILEMAKLRMIRIYQSDPLAPIHVQLSSEKPPQTQPGQAEADDGKAETAKVEDGKPETARAADAIADDGKAETATADDGAADGAAVEAALADDGAAEATTADAETALADDGAAEAATAEAATAAATAEDGTAVDANGSGSGDEEAEPPAPVEQDGEAAEAPEAGDEEEP